MKLEKHSKVMLKLNVSSAERTRDLLTNPEYCDRDKLERAEETLSILIDCLQHLIDHETE